MLIIIKPTPIKSSRNESSFFRCEELKLGTDVAQGDLSSIPDGE